MLCKENGAVIGGFKKSDAGAAQGTMAPAPVEAPSASGGGEKSYREWSLVIEGADELWSSDTARAPTRFALPVRNMGLHQSHRVLVRVFLGENTHGYSFIENTGPSSAKDRARSGGSALEGIGRVVAQSPGCRREHDDTTARPQDFAWDFWIDEATSGSRRGIAVAALLARAITSRAYS